MKNVEKRIPFSGECRELEVYSEECGKKDSLFRRKAGNWRSIVKNVQKRIPFPEEHLELEVYSEECGKKNPFSGGKPGIGGL